MWRLGRWILGLSLVLGVSARGVIPEATEVRSPAGYAQRLADPDRREATLEALIRARDVETLSQVARGADDAAARGWAVVGLSRLPGPGLDRTLAELQASDPSMLVRTWAAAARVGRARSLDELRHAAAAVRGVAGIERPLRLRFEHVAHDATVEDLLALSMEGALASAVSPLLVARKPVAELVDHSLHHPDDAMRRQAAAYLATLAQSSPNQRSQVSGRFLAAIAVTSSSELPWDGGALFVPGIAWGAADGRRLIHTLMAWWLRLEGEGRRDALRPVWNNLYSYQLLTGAGYDMSLSADAGSLVQTVVRVEGVSTAREILRDAGRLSDPAFRQWVR